MALHPQLKAMRNEILELAAKRGAYNVRVFGSAARGDIRPDSDVDFLVDMEADRSLFDMGALLMDLQDLLGREIHLVTEKALHWYIKDRIIDEAVPL